MAGDRRVPLRPLWTALLLLVSTAAFAQNRPDALAMYRNGQYAEAVQTCLNEIQQMPKDLDSYAVLGWSLLKLGRYQDAVNYSLQALGVSRYDPRIVEILGEAYYFLGQSADALRYFQEYAVLAPNGDRIDDVYYYMGETYIRLGEFNHADIAITTAVYYSPNIAQWWTRLGYAREMAGNYQLALDAYSHALALNPASVDAGAGKARVAAKLAE